MDMKVAAGFAAVKSRNRIILTLLAVFLAVMMIAWIDGGEEPLRPIVEELDVPGAGA